MKGFCCLTPTGPEPLLTKADMFKYASRNNHTGMKGTGASEDRCEAGSVPPDALHGRREIGPQRSAGKLFLPIAAILAIVFDL